MGLTGAESEADWLQDQIMQLSIAMTHTRPERWPVSGEKYREWRRPPEASEVEETELSSVNLELELLKP